MREPIVRPEFSDVIGSCSTMAICLPRMRRIWAGVLASRSSPSRSTRPPKMRPAGSGTRRTSDRHVTDFPEPDSPTRASVSPASRVKLTPSTARVTPRRVKKCVRRSSTTSSGDERLIPRASLLLDELAQERADLLIVLGPPLLEVLPAHVLDALAQLGHHRLERLV